MKARTQADVPAPFSPIELTIRFETAEEAVVFYQHVKTQQHRANYERQNPRAATNWGLMRTLMRHELVKQGVRLLPFGVSE